MFGIHKKLTKWQDAGLIAPDQMHAILAHESSHTQGRFARGMIGIALFAIGIGILSIIAANWLWIPGAVKLGVHSLVNAGLAFAIWRMMGPDVNLLKRDSLVLILFFLTLTWICWSGWWRRCRCCFYADGQKCLRLPGYWHWFLRLR